MSVGAEAGCRGGRGWLEKFSHEKVATDTDICSLTHQIDRGVGSIDAFLLDSYALGPAIGVGHSASVRLCRNVYTGEKLACKSISKAYLEVCYAPGCIYAFDICMCLMVQFRNTNAGNFQFRYPTAVHPGMQDSIPAMSVSLLAYDAFSGLQLSSILFVHGICRLETGKLSWKQKLRP